MAIRYAVASGNWSNTATWNGGTLPTSADDVYSNTFTVTIDTSPTVLSISNSATTGVTAGGTFIPSNGITITCTGAGVVAGTVTNAHCVTSSLISGQSFSIVGNCTGGNANPSSAVSTSTGGTINITGNCIGGNSNSSTNCGVINSGAGTVNITGNCTAGSGAGSNNNGAKNSGTGVINITGTVTGTSGGGSSYGADNSSSGTLTIVGTIQAGNLAGVGPGASTQSTVLSGPFLTTANGVNPVSAVRWFWANSNITPTYYQIRTLNLAAIRPLYTADSVGGNPAISDVRSGTVYGPANELTGTCAVPGAASVMIGVPVDNTVGTAAISASDIKNACSKAIVPALLALG